MLMFLCVCSKILMLMYLCVFQHSSSTQACSSSTTSWTRFPGSRGNIPSCTGPGDSPPPPATYSSWQAYFCSIPDIPDTGTPLFSVTCILLNCFFSQCVHLSDGDCILSNIVQYLYLTIRGPFHLHFHKVMLRVTAIFMLCEKLWRVCACLY